MTLLVFSRLAGELRTCQLVWGNNWRDPSQCWSVSAVSSCSSLSVSRLKCWVTPTNWTTHILDPRTEQFQTSWWDRSSFLFRGWGKILRYELYRRASIWFFFISRFGLEMYSMLQQNYHRKGGKWKWRKSGVGRDLSKNTRKIQTPEISENF